jgi:uncharacterized iron-regulated membrane protein
MALIDQAAVAADTDTDEGIVKSVPSLRRWSAIHKWSSLLCTAFLFVICLTGLPLLFSDEINQWLKPHVYEALPAATPTVSLDRLVETGRQLYPGEIISSIFIDDDEPQVFLWMAPSWAAIKADRKSEHFIRFDARTAKVLEQSSTMSDDSSSFIGIMLSLHRELFAGLPGELFMGLMAALFVVAIISGIALYAPFARKIDFGTIRRNRARRLKWLDLHNLFGVVTLAWALVVVATGLMNELSTPLFGLWEMTDVRAMLEQWRGKPVPSEADLSPPQAAFDSAQRAVPGMRITNINFPGGEDGSPYHYVLWAKGPTPLMSRLFNPVIVDARTGAFTAIIRMPWYLRALEISRPLHFGDYGGMPLKIIWALLDLVTLVVLGSGIYLWLSGRQTPATRRSSELVALSVRRGASALRESS